MFHFSWTYVVCTNLKTELTILEFIIPKVGPMLIRPTPILINPIYCFTIQPIPLFFIL